MVNQPLLTASTVPQLSPVTTPKWQTGMPTTGSTAGSVTSTRPPGSTLLIATSGVRWITSQSVIWWLVSIVVPSGVLSRNEPCQPITLPCLSETVPDARQWPAVNAMRVCGVDVAERAQHRVLMDLHAGVDHDAGLGAGRRRRQHAGRSGVRPLRAAAAAPDAAIVQTTEPT